MVYLIPGGSDIPESLLHHWRNSLCYPCFELICECYSNKMIDKAGIRRCKRISIGKLNFTKHKLKTQMLEMFLYATKPQVDAIVIHVISVG